MVFNYEAEAIDEKNPHTFNSFCLVVEHLLMVQWVVGSISHGGHIDLFLIPPKAPMTGITKAICAILVHLKYPLL